MNKLGTIKKNEKNTFVHVLFFVFLILGCVNSNKTELPIEVINQKSEKKFSLNTCDPKDTITNDNFFLRYDCVNKETGEFRLSWGNENFERQYKEPSYCRIEEGKKCGDLPQIEFIDSEYFYLKRGREGASVSSCESMMFEQIILPKNKTDSIFSIPLYIKTEENYTISLYGHNIIHLTNHLTKKRHEFELDPPPSMIFKTLENSIETLKIRNNELSVVYKRYEGENEDELIIKRKFKIE